MALLCAVSLAGLTRGSKWLKNINLVFLACLFLTIKKQVLQIIKQSIIWYFYYIFRLCPVPVYQG